MAWSAREIYHDSIIHAERDTKFTFRAFANNFDKYGLRLSLGAFGLYYDNVTIKSFRARMRTELRGRRKCVTSVELGTGINEYINYSPNHQRRQSSLDMLKPTE